MMILPGFLPLNICSIIGTFLSVSLNSLVIFLMLTRPTNLDRKTVKFSLAFSTLGVIYAICQCLTQPVFFAHDRMGVLFFGSFLHDEYWPVYAQKIFVNVTFIHSDDPAVHSQLSVQIRRDMQRWFVGALAGVGAAYLAAYLSIRWSKITPSPAFVEKVATQLNGHFQTDFRKVFVGGIDTTVQNEQKDPAYAILMILFFLLMIGSTSMMIICGWRIHSTIYRKKMSDRVRKLHRKVLSLIVLQALNPFFFMILPGFIPAILIQSRIESPEALSWLCAYLIILFPLLNPIIMLVCTKEYRRSFLRLLFGSNIPAISVAEFSLVVARRSTVSD
ncbi:hypothetical protein PRIPAC_94683 [Pristionchus pacificus]|uniref:G protein-coupled receptor n=1 Tax=Pristionchus pacificus TaxID=54126 RepID=A0A2A6BIH4_PRIPA|nr:hypothetical protein PRIPAC_94683 [Pristionchus pacificus]|eukprot:PDM65689.1 G protein-coupled receptor [Pristionchus pacificus]